MKWSFFSASHSTVGSTARVHTTSCTSAPLQLCVPVHCRDIKSFVVVAFPQDSFRTITFNKSLNQNRGEGEYIYKGDDDESSQLRLES